MTHHKTKLRYAVIGLGHIAQVAVLPAFKSSPNSELFALVPTIARSYGRSGKNIDFNISMLMTITAGRLRMSMQFT